MRRAVTAAVLAVVATATACTSTASPNAPADPKSAWISAVKAAGFDTNPGHTFDEMFESSKVFCAAGSALAISGLARTALSPELVDITSMPAREANPDTAAVAYGDATWKWACEH